MTQSWRITGPAAPVVDYRTGGAWSPARPRPATLIDILETAACVGILLLMSQALLGRLGDPEQTGQGAPWLRTMWLPCYAVILALIALRPPRLMSVWPAMPILMALVAWAFVSRQWSLDPDATFRRSLALLFATLFGLHMAGRYSWRGLIEIVALASLILAVGCLIAVIAFPAFGKMQDVYVGAWRGLWFEKNAMGGYMARGALACACAAILSPARRPVWIGGAGLCAALTVMTGSTTALLAVIIALAGLAGLAFLRRGPIWTVVGVWLFVVVCLVAAAILMLAPDLFFSAVGKEPTLTGRTGLWEALERQIARQPLTGYGYGGFWQGKDGPAEIVRKEIQWSAHNADNAWMEIRVQLGLVGLWLMIATLATYCVAALAGLWKGTQAYWTVLFVVLVGIFSISESMLARPNDATWVVFVATFAKMLQWRGSDTAY